MSNWNLINIAEIEFKRIEAEFYQKKYMDAKLVAGDKLLKHYGVFVIHPAEVKREYSDKGTLQIVLAQNVRDNVMDWTTKNFMDKSKLKYISRNKLKKDDVLVTRSGANYGQTSVMTIEPAYQELFASADVLIVDSGGIGGPLLSTYLNSDIGKKLMLRGVYGAGQPHVAPAYISHIPFPEYLLPYKNEITTCIYNSRELEKQSQDLYQQATVLLDKELGLDTIEFKKLRSYTASFSEVISNNRADSEYYQVHFRQIEEHLKSLKTLSLGTICSFIKGYEVGSSLYTENGPTFIRVSNFTKQGFSFGDSDKHISNSTYNFFKAYKPNIGDILLTKDGTVGTCYVVDEEVEGIISSGIVNLTLLDETIPKEYLALVINSKICQIQAKRDCSGALISHWKPQDIRKMIIPLLDVDTMQQLDDLVVESKSALRQSQQLLEQSKQRVEELIENEAGVSNE